MSRSLLKYYLKTMLACLILLSLARICFIVYQMPFTGSSSTDMVVALVYGLMVDASVCSVSLTICFLLASPFLFFLRRIRIPAHVLLTRVFFLLLILVSITDVFYFAQFGTRLTILAMNIFDDTSEITGTIMDSFPVFSVLGIAAALYLVLLFLSRRWKRHIVIAEPNRPVLLLYFFLSAAALSFLYLGPPFWRITGTFGNGVYNQACLNGIYSFIKSADQEGINANEIPEHAYGDLPSALNDIKNVIRGKDEKYIPCGFSEFRRQRTDSLPFSGKNVVIIIMESFGANLCGALNDGNGFTPGFDAWADSGILFTDFYSNGPRTVQGLVSTTASFPAILGGHPIRRKGLNEMQTIGNVFSDKGYLAQFIHNGDAGFDDMDVFMKGGGFSVIVDKQDYPSPLHRESRGVSDEDLFLKAYDMIWKNGGKPKLSVLLSLTNHKPYEVPQKFIDEFSFMKGLTDMEQGMVYSDHALSKFLDRCSKHPEFSNTIFFILGDHAEMYKPEDSELGIFHIPLLILNSGKVPGRDSTTGSQVDVAPTVISLTHLSCEHHFLGQDLLDVARKPFAFCKGYGNDIVMSYADTAIKYYFEDRRSEYFSVEKGRYLVKQAFESPAFFVTLLENYLQVTSHVYRTGKHRFK